ncbi:MAG TPA: SRPBCC domain-containing protein [Polyangiaceae bacterium]|nr:SRPBCC domain-containing protein [Polyangiaceae bacterium]
MNTRSEARGKVVIERSYRADIGDVWDLWTTKDGFESWWGPQGFRVEVNELDARAGGALRYEMIADSPEMIAAMKRLGRPASHPTNSRFTELHPRERLVITSLIDFIPGVTPYENRIVVDFKVLGRQVRMSVTLEALHTEEMSKMQQEGFTSQLTKLDSRFDSTLPGA